jgi:competence protein ComEA
MFKKISASIAVFIATIGFAFAQVDINKADQAALDGIKGIGPKTSKAILDERKKGGDFKDWADLENRVKGIGGKSAMKLSQGGLTINGQAKSNAPAAALKEAKKSAKTEEKAVKADAKDAKKAASTDIEIAKKDVKKSEAKK